MSNNDAFNECKDWHFNEPQSIFLHLQIKESNHFELFLNMCFISYFPSYILNQNVLSQRFTIVINIKDKDKINGLKGQTFTFLA